MYLNIFKRIQVRKIPDRQIVVMRDFMVCYTFVDLPYLHIFVCVVNNQLQLLPH